MYPYSILIPAMVVSSTLLVGALILLVAGETVRVAHAMWQRRVRRRT